MVSVAELAAPVETSPVSGSVVVMVESVVSVVVVVVLVDSSVVSIRP